MECKHVEQNAKHVEQNAKHVEQNANMWNKMQKRHEFLRVAG